MVEPEISLCKYFKKQKTLLTDVGEFIYKQRAGEGGNSFVLKFSKETKKVEIDFAIKFLKPINQEKVNRFKDEYFCAMQISSHPNVVSLYHFDKIELNYNELKSEYFIIVMKYYLKDLKQKSKDDNEKDKKVWKLFDDLAKAIDHLHKNGIIHRDIKPQNIFCDHTTNNYVLGDLGIARFSDENFAREAKTETGDRLANYDFSAPEQFDSTKTVTNAADIYALGQVIQWYLTGSTNRGVNRTRFSSIDSSERLQLLDNIVEICLNHEPTKRFQTIGDIIQFIENSKKRDIWERIEDFDKVIRYSFPSINEIYEASNPDEIADFINEFNDKCLPEEFCWVDVKYHWNQYSPIKAIDVNNKKWLLSSYELDIEKLIIYKDDSLYRSFFIILANKSQPFEIVNNNNVVISKDKYSAVYWQGKYIDSQEIKNGWYKNGEEKISTSDGSFEYRDRYDKNYIYMIVPEGNSASTGECDEPVHLFLQSILDNSRITEDSLDEYLDTTQRYHDKEIRGWK